MRPLSFQEFLYNLGYHKVLELLAKTPVENPIDAEMHNRILKILREYMLLGGMPSIVNNYIKAKSDLNSHRLQTALLESYRNDFGKYASNPQFKNLKNFFIKAPSLLGRHFKYVKVDPEVRARLENCFGATLFHRLNHACVGYTCQWGTAAGGS